QDADRHGGAIGAVQFGRYGDRRRDGRHDDRQSARGYRRSLFRRQSAVADRKLYRRGHFRRAGCADLPRDRELLINARGSSAAVTTMVPPLSRMKYSTWRLTVEPSLSALRRKSPR